MKKLLMVLSLLPLMAAADIWTDSDTGIVWTVATQFAFLSPLPSLEICKGMNFE